MRKLTRFLSLGLIGVLMTSMFAGCGEKAPTAEELISSMEVNTDCMRSGFRLVLDMDASGEELTGNSDTSMSMTINMDSSIKMTKDVIHVQGKMSAELLDMNYSENIETYTITEDGVTKVYTYDSDDESWSVSAEDEASDMFTAIADIDISKISNLRLVDSQNKDEYAISGKVKSSDLSEDGVSSIIGDFTETDDTQDILFDFTATFDKRSKDLTSIAYVIDTESISLEDVTFNEFTMELYNIDFDDFDIEVPNEVIENAVEDDYDIEEYDDYDDEEEETSSSSSGWSDYSIAVNGKELELPCSYSDIENAFGYSIKSADAKSYIESGASAYSDLYDGDDDIGVYLSFFNENDEDTIYTDCSVYNVTQSLDGVEDYNAPLITFPYGLQVGQKMSDDDLIALIGEPSDRYDYDSGDGSYIAIDLTWSEDTDWTSRNCMTVSIENGVVDTITLNHID